MARQHRKRLSRKKNYISIGRKNESRNSKIWTKNCKLEDSLDLQK